MPPSEKISDRPERDQEVVDAVKQPVEDLLR